MKFLSKITFAVLALGLTFALSSCSEDDSTCGDCDEVEVTEQGITFTLPAWNACVGDDDGSGGTITQADIDLAIEQYEAEGANCSK